MRQDRDRERTCLIGMVLEALKNIPRCGNLESQSFQWHISIVFVLQGFGGRVMRSQGWEEGQGLGRQSRGIATPLEADGQLPRNKKGLGYVHHQV